MSNRVQTYTAPKLVFAALMFCIALLLLASITAKFLVHKFGLHSLEDDGRLHLLAIQRLIEFLDVNDEQNLPSWFSSSLLLSAGFLALLIASLSFKHGVPWKVHWLSIGLLFVALSLDESASLHELLMRPIRQIFGTSGFLRYAWVIPGSIAVLVLTVVYLRFVAALPRFMRLKVIASAGIFVSGAIGMEMVGASYHDNFTHKNLTYDSITTVEEGLEMVGVTLFIYALLRYLEATFSYRTAVRSPSYAAQAAPVSAGQTSDLPTKVHPTEFA